MAEAHAELYAERFGRLARGVYREAFEDGVKNGRAIAAVEMEVLRARIRALETELHLERQTQEYPVA